MRKFIKGTFELDQNVTDLVEYEKKHETMLNKLVEWATRLNIAINIGTSEDNTYLCEFKIVGATASYCRGLCSELKQMLKAEFPKTKSIWQGSGDVLF